MTRERHGKSHGYKISTISSAAIDERIHEIRKIYVQTGRARSFQGINRGLCGDFASDVIESFGGSLTSRLHDVSPASFQTVVKDDFGDGRPFDRKLLRRFWPKVIPPLGMTWNNLDQLSEEAGFGNGTHVWLTDERLHYDAEYPQGVENFLDLPFFRRVINSWRKSTNGRLHCGAHNLSPR